MPSGSLHGPGVRHCRAQSRTAAHSPYVIARTVQLDSAIGRDFDGLAWLKLTRGAGETALAGGQRSQQL